MTDYDKYRQIAVQIECRTEMGSGCLFQSCTSDYTYVFTAKHCLIGKNNEHTDITIKDITIVRNYPHDSKVSLKVLNFYLHSDQDLALILVEYIEELPQINLDIPNNPTVYCYGYPVSLLNESRQAHRLPSKINDSDGYSFEVISEQNLSTHYKSETANVIGFSGSGVFCEVGSELVLVGILSRFKSSGGTFQAIIVLNIANFHDLITNNDLAPLIPQCLISFREYIDAAFETCDDNVEAVLRNSACKISGLTPLDIVNEFGDKMFLPFASVDKLNCEVWKGWITLLTYLSLESGQCQLDKTCMLRTTKNNTTHLIKFFYSTNIKKLSGVVRYIFTQISADEFTENDVIVFNHDGGAGGTVYLKKEDIENIVTDISGSCAELYKNGVYIDQPGWCKIGSCIHLNYFNMVFTDKCKDIPASKTLEEKLRKCISEVLDSAS